MSSVKSMAWRWLLLGVMLVCVLGLLFVSLARHDVLAPPGQEIVWDDFGFALEGVSESTEVGPPGERVRPKGRFVVVHLRTTNHAQRVDYDLAGHTPLLESESGARWSPDPAATSALRRELGLAAPTSIAPGAKDVSPFVYDVPAGSVPVRVRITWGGDALQTLDLILFGDRALAIEMPR